VLEADRRLMAEVLPALVKCYQETHREKELERYLEGLINQDQSLQKEIAYAAILNELTEPALLPSTRN